MAQVTILNAGTQATALAGGTDWFLMHRTGNADANRVLLRDLLNPGNLAVKSTPVAADKFLIGDSADATNVVKHCLRRDLLDPVNLTAKNTPVAADLFVVGDSADTTNKVKSCLRRDILDPSNLTTKTTPVAADTVTLGDSADGTNKVKKVTTTDLCRFPTFTTAGRPSAVTLGAGARYYDTTLSKPGWSDGTVWRDAAGTAI